MRRGIRLLRPITPSGPLLALAAVVLVLLAASDGALANHGPYSPGSGFGPAHWWHSRTQQGVGFESAPIIRSHLGSAWSRGGVDHGIWVINNKPRNSPWYQWPSYTSGDTSIECSKADVEAGNCPQTDGEIRLYDGNYGGLAQTWWAGMARWRLDWFWRWDTGCACWVAMPTAAHIRSGFAAHNLDAVNHPNSLWCHELLHEHALMHPTPQTTTCLTDNPIMYDGNIGNGECSNTWQYGSCLEPDAHDIDSVDSASNHNEEPNTKPGGVGYASLSSKAASLSSRPFGVGPPTVLYGPPFGNGRPGEIRSQTYEVACLVPSQIPQTAAPLRRAPIPFDFLAYGDGHCLVRLV